MEAKDVVVSSQLHVFLDKPEDEDLDLDKGSLFVAEIREVTGLVVSHLEQECDYVEISFDWDDINMSVKVLEEALAEIFARHIVPHHMVDNSWVPVEWKSPEITPLPLAA